MQSVNSLERTLILGKIEGKRRSRQQRMRWLDSITGWRDMNFSKLQEMVKEREAWHAIVHGVTKSWTWLSYWTEMDSKEMNQSVLYIHWKDWCWCWSSNTLATWCNSQLTGKDPDAGKNWRQKEKRETEAEKVGWHHQFDGHELGQTLGVGEW